MDFNKLADFIKNIGKNYSVPGCDISVYYNHINVFRMHSGFSDEAGKVKVSRKNLYFMNSGAKIMCCAALMMLAQSYALSLGDPVARFVPGVPAGITVREFIKKYSAENRTEDEVFGFDTVKKLIASASGKSFDEFLESAITRPLKMKSTTFNLNSANEKLIAAQYNYMGEGKTPIECATGVRALHDKHTGCLITSVDDYALFTETLTGGGLSKAGKRLLSRESTEKLIGDLVYNETEKDGAFVSVGNNGSLVLIDMKKKISIVYAQHMRNMDASVLSMYPELRKTVYECIGADTWSLGYNIFP